MKNKSNLRLFGLLILSLLLSLPLRSQEELGRPFITNYDYHDYGAGPVNWWSIEDDRGIMYFANNEGILEYDGTNWRIVPYRNGVAEYPSVRSFAKDDKGQIYVGLHGDIGYIEADEKGMMEFVSLKSKLPEEDQVFEEVWETDFWKGEIYYRTNHKIFNWDGEQMMVIHSEHALHVGSKVRDQYYIRLWDVGLCLFEADTFRLVPNGEKFASDRIYSLLPYGEDQLLVGSRSSGFYIYDGRDFTPFKTEIDELVKNSLYLPGLALDGDRYLFNSFQGIFIIDKNGKLLQKITKDDGLQDNTVGHVYLDSRGILWMALFKGISTINLNSRFTVFGEQSGLISNNVFGVARHKGVLYAGTNNGVYYLDKLGNTFKHVTGTYGQVQDLKIVQGQLLCASGGMGLFAIEGADFRMIRASINYDYRAQLIFPSIFDTHRIYVSVQNRGLSSLYYDKAADRWVDESFSDKVQATWSAIAETDEGHLWITGKEKGTLDYLIPPLIGKQLDLAQSQITRYDRRHGLPSDQFIYIREFGDQIQFHTVGTSDVLTFDPVREQFDASQPVYSEFVDSSTVLFTMPVEDQMGRVWLNAGNGPFFASQTPEGTYQITGKPFFDLKDYPSYQIYPEASNDEHRSIVWFSGPDGIVRYEGNLEDPVTPDFNILLRHVELGEDSVIFAGTGDLPKQLAVDYRQNTIRFEFSSPFPIKEQKITYQTYLEGLDRHWSAWTRQTEREYINLPAGAYTFKVKARNLYGEESQEASFDFTVMPPWYNSWWAYLLYALAAVALVWGIVINRTQNLRKRELKLKEKVKERTQEVEQRLDELATVNRVSLALTEQLELSDLIQLVGDQMKTLFKSNITYLAIHDPKTNMINFPYQYGDDMAPLRYGEGFTSKIIMTGEPLLINRDINKTYEKIGIQRVGKEAASYLGVPIPVEDKVIGVLSVQSTEEENRFREQDKRLLSTIARNVGIALHNAELYEEAKAAKVQAEEANETKSAFLSTVSHELRTPLTSVLGFAKIIKKRLESRIFPAIESEDKRINKAMHQVSQNLDVVVSEGERLTKLINDVLDLAKIESGKVDWNFQPIFVQDVVNRALASTISLFETRQMSLKTEIAPDLPVINGDLDKLIQVMVNLLSNAVKFTNEGEVKVVAFRQNDQIVVEVRDTGIGIDEADHEKVFERFRQAGDTLTNKPQGTGLGLPICKEIIEHHGGSIGLSSEPGKGSTFHFTVPILGDGGKARPIQLDKVVESLKKQIALVSKPVNGKEHTILVVDDDTPIRSLLRQELSEAGYHVREAPNGKAALDLVRVHRPDLILLDVMMPEMNGFDVAAVLKNDPDTMDIPIIILSIVQDQERGYNIGVDRYLTKPIDTEQLFREVGSLLEQGVSNKKVLVIEENGSTLKTLTTVLTKRGYKVVESDGKNAVKKAMSVQPDIIMLNSMQNGNQEIVKTLRFDRGLEHVLFLVYE